MKFLSSKTPETEPSTVSCGIAEQWKEMGLAIGEMKRERSRLSKYLERIQARKSWWQRWFWVG